MNVGVAAHIHAASAEGPRYKPEQTSEERRSIDNGIWLCTTCGKQVDSDESQHTADMLQSWKQQAEAAATMRLHQKPLSKLDVQQQIAATLYGSPSRQGLQAFANTREAATSHLNSLDSRMRTKVSFVGDAPQVELWAIEDGVQMNMTFHGADIDPMRAAVENIVKHGRGGTVELSHMKVSGSPLFEYLHEDGPVKLEMWAADTPAMVRCLMADESGATRRCIATLEGVAVSGTESLTASVSAFDGVMKLEVCVPFLRAGARKSADMQLTLDAAPWDGKDVRLNAHLTTLSDLLEGWNKGRKLELEVFIDEERIATFDGTKLTSDGFIKQHATRMVYARNARTLAEHFDRRIAFMDDYVPSWEEFAAVSRAAATVTDTLIPTGDPFSEDLYVAVGDEFLAEREKHMQQANVAFQLVVGARGDVTVFGQTVHVPPVLAHFSGRIVDVVDINGDGIQYAVIRRNPGTTTTYAVAP
ncbi:hypothetical protein ACQ86G_19225 [Roseateles chitinivorans]|uniref:hypothetical protein n=1 Tax=Roseateles chitinivorans TaxID=2917965 RepID=UPI003D66B223